jgi:hypothetical protein
MRSWKRYTAALLCTCGLAGAAVPASAGAESPVFVPGMELVFAGETAQSVGDQIVVPVRCIGEGPGFCSGVVTLSGNGHRRTVPFSVQAGTRESLFVPLRFDGAGPVSGVAKTDQRLGPPSSTKTLLYIH